MRPSRTPTVVFVTSAAALLVAAVTAMVATPSAHAAPGCRVDYTVANQWPGGFTANVVITNLGDPINGWTLHWSFPSGQSISSSWNGSFTQSGSQVTVTDAGWNASLGTGANTSVGFNGTFTSTNTNPTSFTLNGTACTGSVPSPSPSSPGSPSPSLSPSAPPSPSVSPSPSSPIESGRQMERLNRGVTSVRSGSGNLVSWRLLGSDPAGVTFALYRGSTRIYTGALTNFLDAGAAANSSYTVRAIVNGTEQAASPTSINFETGYRDVPLQIPAGGTTPDGVAYTYSANDVSVGDLDGDGVLDFVVKWDPSNAKDNAHSGYTGNVYLDGYRLNGQRLWRIDLGRNIRAGAHYTQFQVYDYDGDGRAEVAVKTADATVSGTGQVIGNGSANHRNSSGYILTGPEFLTMFEGSTGRAMSTVNYEPARGTVSSWGDNYGNRVDRFLAGTAYLDGQRPSLIMSRGYYTRTVIVAWDFRNGSLTRRWTFDSNVSGSQYAGQGAHSLSIADVDNDGRDEVIFGGMAINDNGAPLWNTRLGHGDALHVGDFVTNRPGLEVFMPSEWTSSPAARMVDARTGQIIWTNPSCNCDNGRGVAGDIWAGSPGGEAWSSAVSDLRNSSGNPVGRKPSSTNFLIWWDGDAVRELLDGTRIDKYGPSGDTRLLTGSGVSSNNGTKSTPAISGDLFGDWREEVVWRLSNSSALRIYATPHQTDRRLYTLLHDAQYRVALAWQNTAYNQPPHPSYFIGDGMTTPTPPVIYVR